MVRHGLVVVLFLALVACAKGNPATPAPSSGPAFTTDDDIYQRTCGEDLCLIQTIKNVGNEAGGGECVLIKFDFLQSHKDTKGPKVTIPTVQPQETIDVVARWPLDDIARRNVFGFSCEPGPLM